jgi:hypothetical protein
MLGFALSLLGLLLVGGWAAGYASGVHEIRSLPRWSVYAGGAVGLLGLLISMGAVFRFPKTAASRGVMLGMLCALALAGVGAFHVAERMGLLDDPENIRAQREQRTREVMAQALNIIRGHSMQSGIPPNSRLGTQLISQLRDGWGREFSYQLFDNREFEITSAGPDGEFGNVDDLNSDELLDVGLE